MRSGRPGAAAFGSSSGTEPSDGHRGVTATHIVGAGLAGLSAALTLAGGGHGVIVHESAPRAGGRCRSFVDAGLGRTIDNGNHLLLSGNVHAMRYLAAIGAENRLTGPSRALFPFVDLGDGTRWTLEPGAGRWPWWILDPRRRVPGTGVSGYAAGLLLAAAGAGRTVGGCVGERGACVERFWEPLAVAVLNTPIRHAAARPLWRVLAGTFLRGEAFCRPRLAERSLAETFIDPALDVLRGHGVAVRFNDRLQRLDAARGEARRLVLSSGSVDLERGDRVILAVPPAPAGDLVPGLDVPLASQGIVNVHYLPAQPPRLVPDGGFLGLVGGTAQWIFARERVLSVTVSAANPMMPRSAEGLARDCWRDVASALDFDPADLPPWRVIKEKRATLSQDPDTLKARPGARTPLANVFLAGDWTDTGLPATIEGAVLSGERAALASLAR